MRPALLLQIGAAERWIIYDLDGPSLWSGKPVKILWRREAAPDENTGGHSWPNDMRTEYERLVGRGEFTKTSDLAQMPEAPNLVELVADPDQCGYDQPCRHGHRVEHHAVYCHNERWLYAPSKCRRGEWLVSIYGGSPEDYRHDRCPGYAPNPLYKPPNDA